MYTEVGKLRRTFSLGNSLVLDLFSSLRSEYFVQCTFQEDERAVEM